MKAIFNRNCDCIAWQEEESGYLFDQKMNWIGFLEDDYIFSRSTRWLGGHINGSYNDKNGQPVAWAEGSEPQSTLSLLQPFAPLQPLTPLQPLMPLSPLRPLMPLPPLGGWSNLSWEEFLNQ